MSINFVLTNITKNKLPISKRFTTLYGKFIKVNIYEKLNIKLNSNIMFAFIITDSLDKLPTDIFWGFKRTYKSENLVVQELIIKDNIFCNGKNDEEKVLNAFKEIIIEYFTKKYKKISREQIDKIYENNKDEINLLKSKIIPNSDSDDAYLIVPNIH